MRRFLWMLGVVVLVGGLCWSLVFFGRVSVDGVPSGLAPEQIEAEQLGELAAPFDSLPPVGIDRYVLDRTGSVPFFFPLRLVR